MKNNKKPLIIILVLVAMVVVGLLFTNYMFKQVDINLEKKETSQSHLIYFEQDTNFTVFINQS